MHLSRISSLASQHALHLVGVALVEQQNRMDVAVAGVEDVDDADVVTSADVGDELRGSPAASCAARRRPACSSWGSAGRSRRTPACGTSRAAAAPSASLACRTSRAPVCWQMLDDLLALRRRRPTSRPSTSMSSTAPASSGKPKWNAASTASMIPWSIISSAAGTMPAPMMSLMACVASSTEFEDAQHRAVRWRDRASAGPRPSCTMPNVPSLPTNRPVRS